MSSITLVRELSAPAIALAVAAAICPAVAAEDSWYVTPSYHQTGIDNASAEFKESPTRINFNASFGDDTGPGLAAGHAFHAPYRIDVEYQSHSNDLKVSGTPLRPASLDVTTFVANVWHDFGAWHGVRPYIGVGAGGGTLQLHDLDSNFEFGQVGVGVQWYFTRRVALDVGYRYQAAFSKPELRGNSQQLSFDYTAQSAQIGVRFDVW